MTREKILLILLGVFILAFLVLGYITWNLWTRVQEESQGRATVMQNLAATRDSAGALHARLSEAAIFIRDLEDSVEDGRKLVRALEAQFSIALDSVRAAGAGGVAVVSKDSIWVPFFGKDRFVAYQGWTLYQPGPPARTSYKLNLDFDQPRFNAGLLRDESTGLWLLSIESLTPGLKYRSTTTLDSVTYQLLQKYPAPERARWFGIGAIGNGESAYAAVSLQVGGAYEVIGGYALSRPPEASAFIIGGFWRP